MLRYIVNSGLHIGKMMIHLLLVICLYGGVSAQTTVSEEKDSVAKELAEIVVEAKREIHTDESDIYYLSSKNQRFGTNALDAISSLRQFTPVIDGMSLTTVDQKSVAILINGHPSTPQDLRGYTGKEIKKVTYYPVAPPRYSDITDGPIVDVTVKVDKDYINAFVSVSNSVNSGYGTDQAVLRWADSLNMVRADYFIDYRDLRSDKHDSYIYPGSAGLDRDYRTSSKYKGHYQYGKISWQNTAKKDYLYLSGMFSHNPGDREYENRASDGFVAGDEEEDYSRSLSSNTDVGSINFFYMRKTGKGRLDMQANGSIGKTSSENILWYRGAQGNSTSFTNHTYMAYGKLMYYLPVRKVNLFFTGSYSYQHTDHDRTLPSRYTYDTDRNTINLSAAMTGKIPYLGRRLSYNLGVAMKYQDIRNTRQDPDLTRCNFTPYLTLSSTISKKLFIRLRGYVKSGMPSLGELSSEPTYQESNLAWRGDPDLKGWTMYGVALQPEYVIVPGRLAMNGDFSFRYTTDPIKSVVFGGSPVEVRYANLDYARNADAAVFMTLTPGGVLSVKPYFEWSYNNYSTPNRSIERGYFRYGGTVSVNTPKVQSAVNVNCPYKTFNGDITEYGGWQLSCSVLVKLPANLSVSLMWRHSYQGERTTVYAPGILEYDSRSRYPRLANQIMAGITWSFSHGVFKKRQQTQVSDMESDSGISDFNKATM
ncbi:MAG: outer membrane beta-barrel family protein [Muribaculaceae bacterium]|nr:outer membrane beta-barrel family protein [Muribaculaceae bacterium]